VWIRLTKRRFRNFGYRSRAGKGGANSATTRAMQLIRSQSILTDRPIDQVGAESKLIGFADSDRRDKRSPPTPSRSARYGLLDGTGRVGRGRIVSEPVDLMERLVSLKWRILRRFFNSRFLGPPTRVRPIPKQGTRVNNFSDSRPTLTGQTRRGEGLPPAASNLHRR